MKAQPKNTAAVMATAEAGPGDRGGGGGREVCRGLTEQSAGRAGGTDRGRGGGAGPGGRGTQPDGSRGGARIGAGAEFGRGLGGRERGRS